MPQDLQRLQYLSASCSFTKVVNAPRFIMPVNWANTGCPENVVPLSILFKCGNLKV